MSSVPPPEGETNEPDPDDADTGPLHISAPAAEDDWGPGPGTWAGRFDAPLTVSPRPVRANRRPNVLLAVLVLVVIVVAGGLIFWLVRPSSDTPAAPSTESAPASTPAEPSPNAEDEARLSRLLPAGYSAGSCKPVDPPKDALAQVSCEENSDTGGPQSATYTLSRDKAALDATFDRIVAAANRVNCPGDIQSPGPWRRNATPQKVSGVLFCGLREGRPTVAWTDESKLLVSAVQAGPQAPTFPELYAWWSSHS
jgi:serine/threonine kinase PknH